MPELTGNETSFDFHEMPLFLDLDMASVAILDPKYNKYHSVRSVKPELVENDTSVGFNSPCGLGEITVYVFKYGVGGHYWAAILDFKVKMVS